MSAKASFVLTVAALVSFASLSLSLGQEPRDFRTWTDSTGEFKIEASFEKFEDGKVHLRRKDNDKVLILASTKLSKDDLTHMRKLLADRAKTKRIAPNTGSEPRTGAVENRGEPMVWQGTWDNRKYGTNGPLKCTATVKDDKTWQAKFEGTGLGNPFAYDAVMTTTKKDNRTLLQGTSKVSGDNYQWTGHVEGDTLYGKYRSTSGNNGEFRLTKPRG